MEQNNNRLLFFHFFGYWTSSVKKFVAIECIARTAGWRKLIWSDDIGLSLKWRFWSIKFSYRCNLNGRDSRQPSSRNSSDSHLCTRCLRRNHFHKMPPPESLFLRTYGNALFFLNRFLISTWVEFLNASSVEHWQDQSLQGQPSNGIIILIIFVTRLSSYLDNFHDRDSWPIRLSFAIDRSRNTQSRCSGK